MSRLRGSRYWSSIPDGSLRDNGVEFVHTNPTCGTDLTNSLKEMQAFLDTQPSVDTSVRCSVHVHVDVRDMSIEERRVFLLLCMLYEGFLYTISGEKRRGNPYCTSLNGLADLINVMLIDDQTMNNPPWEKYTAVNLGRLHDLGTFEFRSLEGTTDMNRVMSYINCVTSIRELAREIGTLDALKSWLPRCLVEARNKVFVQSDKYVHYYWDALPSDLNVDGVYALLFPSNLTIDNVAEAETVTLKNVKRIYNNYGIRNIYELPVTTAKQLFGDDILSYVVTRHHYKLGL